MKSARDGAGSTAAVDAVAKATPYVLKAGLASAAPGAAMFGPGAAAAAGQRAGAFIHAGRYGDKIMTAAPHVWDFFEGAIVPGIPPMTRAGELGLLAGKGSEVLKRAYNDNSKKR